MPLGGRLPLGSRLLRLFAWLLVAAYFAAGLGYLALRHLIWPNPDAWLPHVLRIVSAEIGRPIEVGAVRTSFDGLRPALEVDDVVVRDDGGGTAFGAKRIRALLSLRSLATGQLRFARLDIDADALRIERLEPRILKVAGMTIDLDRPMGGVEWVLAQRRIVLRGVTLDWVDRVDGSSLRLERADLALGAVGRRNRAVLRIDEVPGVARGVDAAIEFWRPAFSRVQDWRRWNGQLHLSLARVDLPAVASLIGDLRRPDPASAAPLPLPGAVRPAGPLGEIEVRRGAAAAQLWAQFEAGVPADALLRLAVVGADLGLAGRALPLSSADVEAELRGSGGGGAQLRLHHFALRDDEGFELKAAPDARQMLRIDDAGRLVAGELAVQRFEVAKLLEVTRSLPLPEALRDRLGPMRAGGAIDGLAVSWETPPEAGPAAIRYTVDARLDGLSLARDEGRLQPGQLGMPSFENLSGTVAFSESGGRLTVASRKAVLSFPGLFVEPSIPLEALEARVAWRSVPGAGDAGAGVEVDVEGFRFAGTDAAGEVSGRYSTGGKGVGLVDLSGRLTRADATRVARYLPLGIPADVRDWVGRSIKSGRSDDVRFVLRGDLEDFPYREPGSGDFRIEAALRDATLAYAPGWPAIDKIRGRLLFERAGMDIAVESGQVWGVTLGRTRAAIAEYRDALLRVEGSGQGPASDMVRFVNDSPLRNRIDDFTRDIEIAGAARLALRLEMPLADVDATRVAGSVQFAGNDLVLDRTLPPFSQLAGRLEFTEQALALREMTAGFLGGSVRVDGETPEAGRFLVRASGQVSADGIRQLADNPLTRAFEGTTSWRASVDVRRRAATLSIESDLVGLQSSLPEPFAKAPLAEWPLRIESSPVGATAGDERPQRDLLTIALRDDVRLAFERARDPGSQKMRVRRGVFALASEALMPAAGFAVRLNAPSLDVDAWAAVLGPALEGEASAQPSAQATATPPAGSPPAPPAASSAAVFSLLPSEMSLVARELRLAGKDLHQVVVGATRSGGFWRANVHSREIDGFFNWREALPGQPVGTLTARFTRLEIPRSRVDEVASLLDSAPSVLPALDIAAEDFVLNEHRLGRLALRAVNTGDATAPVWRLEQLKIEHPAATLDARGDWRTPRGGRQRTTALEFDLAIRDAGRLLAVYGLNDAMRGGPGSLSGRVGWIGSPLAIDYPSLGGDLEIALGAGQFLKTDPGLAKLIGVLNLQALRRRLAFDFRDLFAEGFAFDEIRGGAKIARGVAQTENFTMRGVSARVGIRGEANLVAETQNLVVEVRPELNAGLASLAYAALANPAIGLGAFVAQWLLQQPLQQMFAWEYTVTGSWSDPVVERKSRPTIEQPPPSGG